MHIEWYGQGERILFIHGSGWNTHMWHGQRDFLATSMEVILVDLPGHGRSRGDGCESVEEYRDEIYRIIKESNMGKIYVAGHSLGGAITLSLALACPDIVRGVVLIGTGARLRVLPQILEGIIEDREQAVIQIVGMAFSHTSSLTLRNLAIKETMKCPAEVLFKDFQACDGFDITASLSTLTVPTLIICGADDALTPPKYSLYLNKAIDGSKLVFIEEAGHMVMMEKPGEVSTAIKGFLKNKDIPPR